MSSSSSITLQRDTTQCRQCGMENTPTIVRMPARLSDDRWKVRRCRPCLEEELSQHGPDGILTFLFNE